MWALGILVALTLRLYAPDIVPYRLDEAITSAFASMIATGRDFPLLGLRTSFGFHNPPTMFYLAAPIFFLARDPVWFGVLIALLGVVGVVATGLAARGLFGPQSGLAALLLAGCSANALEHSRRIWGHDFIIPATGLVYWCLFARGNVAPSRARLIVACVIAAMTQTLHLSGVLLWIPILWVAYWHRAEGTLRTTLVAAAVTLSVFYMPWIVQNAHTGWEDVRQMSQVVSGESGTTVSHPVTPPTAWVFLAGDGLTDDLLRVLRPWEISPVNGVFSTLANLGALFLLAVGLVFGCFRVLSRDVHAFPCAVLLIALTAPLFLFGVLFRASVPAYMLPAFVPLVMLGAGLFSRCRTPRQGALVVAIYAAVSMGGSTSTLELRDQVAARPEFGVPTIGGLRALAVEVASTEFPVRQDARLRTTGSDTALVYMYYAVSGRSAIPQQFRAGEPMFVAVDPQSRLRPEVLAVLRSARVRDVGGYALHLLTPELAQAYDTAVHSEDASP